MMSKSTRQPVYIAKASWHSTTKLLKIVAADEQEAYDKACKLKEVKGCLKIDIIRRES